jgi:diphosphoinositol-polyphosphate diphosphatase
MREAMEEGGVVGKLGRYLGVFDNPERRHRTRVYVLRVSHLLVNLQETSDLNLTLL